MSSDGLSESAIVHRDMFRAVVGKQLGRGMTRVVYDCTINPSWVFKVEEMAGDFQNVQEWLIWSRVKNTPAAKWFAPCHYISPNGLILVQSRTIPARSNEYVDRIPVFFTDFKRSNYGMLGKRFVCHDYGTALVLDHGVITTKMRKPKWWDE